jgi:hypothetical protein
MRVEVSHQFSGSKISAARNQVEAGGLKWPALPAEILLQFSDLDS